MLGTVVTVLFAISTVALVVLVYNTVRTSRQGSDDPTETARR